MSWRQHVDNPNESTIFKSFPRVLADKDLTHFICDYCRLIIIGTPAPMNRALMDEEIQTVTRDRLKSYHALTSVSDGLPALGIVAAVLGVIRRWAHSDEAPEILGSPHWSGTCWHFAWNIYVLRPGAANRSPRSNQPASRVAVSISL